MAAPCHYDRLAAQRRIIALRYRRIKRVHIYVDDFTYVHHLD
jgi:hypothetical protein